MVTNLIPPSQHEAAESGEDQSAWARFSRWLIGKPRDLKDRRIFHNLSVVAFLAWVGLGADGLSSSAYGPEEAFRTLGKHTYLAVPLAALMMTTVFVISYAYSQIIEHFPSGGGGYVVATANLGPRAGLVSGSALLVDYVLTITISIAAAGDALFSFLPAQWHGFKLPVEVALVFMLTVMNIRGLKESILILTPIFLIFLLTHAVLIVGGVVTQGAALSALPGQLSGDFRAGLSTLGAGGMLLLFMHAYSLGGGTYTGIEAVSNGLSIMREPRVQTGKRTMIYMATSLAITAGGLILCYLLCKVGMEAGKTMNAVLAERVARSLSLGQWFVIITLISEGTLLVVAAQAGFVDGPRVLANMALDSWAPRRFASLSDRLTTQNGIVLMGLTALAALLYTRGDVRQIVVMYSINVFLTFTMTELSMCRYWTGLRRRRKEWSRKIVIHVIGLAMCSTILCVVILEKFGEGGWVTILATGLVVVLFMRIRRHYDKLTEGFNKLNKDLGMIERLTGPAPANETPVDPTKPTAVVLVTSYGGLGIHTLLHIQRAFGGFFKNIVFVSVGVIDSGAFKGVDAIDAQKASVEEMLGKYVSLARRLGWAATSRMAIATEAVDEAHDLCLALSKELDHCVFFSGQVIFSKERWYQRLLHNQTAFAIQKRLQWSGLTMAILPIRVYA